MGLLGCLAMPSELSLVFSFLFLLDQNGDGVAQGEMEAGKLLGLFCLVDLNLVRDLPSTSLCILYSVFIVSVMAIQ